nr:sugar diacid recognition domain-containing protein [Paenibacillus humicola]
MADMIVKETMHRLNRNINIMDESGIIIASGDAARLDQVHEGALEVLRLGKPLMIDEANQRRWKGAQTGINLPIELQGQIVGVIGITGEPQEVREFGGLVKMTTELMLRQTLFMQQSEWKRQTMETIIEELIRGEPNNQLIDERLDMLNVRLRPPFDVCLVDIQDRTFQSQTLMRQIEDTIGQTIAGFISVNRLFILFSGLDGAKRELKLRLLRETFQRWGFPFRIGLTEPVYDRNKVTGAYREAELALLIGEPDRVINTYSDIESKALIYQMSAHARERFAGRVFPESVHKFAESLQAFFDSNQNITEAAKALYIHRNTLIYRLRKIKRETGYDPQLFQEAVPLQMALWMLQAEVRRVRPASGPHTK